MNTYNLLNSYAALRAILEQTKSPFHCIDQLSTPILLEKKGEIVDNEYLCDRLFEKHSLKIPLETASSILIRMKDKGYLDKSSGAFVVTNLLPDNKIDVLIQDVQIGIDKLIEYFINYSRNEYSIEYTKEESSELLVIFYSAIVIGEGGVKRILDEYPLDPATAKRTIILLAGFLVHLMENKSEHINALLHLYQGRLIANATLYTTYDISRGKSLRGTIFYLDSPLLIDLIGLSGNTRRRSALEMLALVKNLGGQFCYYSHSAVEMGNIIRAAAENIDIPLAACNCELSC